MKVSYRGRGNQLINSIRWVFESYPRSVAFFMVFGFILYYNVILKAGTPFHFDSGQYWSFQYLFMREGVWSILHYDNALRGYLWPLVIYTVTAIADLLRITDILFFGLFMAIVYSTGITVAIPFIVEKLFHRKATLAQICLFAIFIVIFWRGYFYYPLADFPALFSIVFGLCLVLLPQKSKIVRGGALTFVSLTIAGMLMAAASNIRPAYLIALAPLIGLIFLYQRNINKYPLKKCISLLVPVLLGIFMVFYPQFVINAANFDRLTPVVLAELKGHNLFLQQLVWGITMQKYETNVGDVYPVAPVRFIDPHGERLLAKTGYIPDSLGKYFQLLWKYPFDFAVIYARRIFNGLDVTYHSAYTSNILQRAIGKRFLNYSIFFLVLLYLVYLLRLHGATKLVYVAAGLFVFILPALLSVPTAIEVRFMLPVFFVSYGIVTYFAIPDLFGKYMNITAGFIKIDLSKSAMYLFLYIAFVVICFMLSVNTFMGLEFGQFILHGG